MPAGLKSSDPNDACAARVPQPGSAHKQLSLSLSISTRPIYTSTLQFFKSSKKANKVIKTVVATWESTFEGVELLHLFLSTLEKIRKGLVDQSSKGNECEWECGIHWSPMESAKR